MKKQALILAVLIALGCPGLALAQPDTDTIARYGRILAGLEGENVDDGATSTINAGAFSSGSDLLEAGVGTDENLSTGVQDKPSPAAPNFGNLTGSSFHFKHRAVGSGSGGYGQMFIRVINDQNRIFKETVSNVANALQTIVIKQRIHKQTHTGNDLLTFQKDFLNLVVN